MKGAFTLDKLNEIQDLLHLNEDLDELEDDSSIEQEKDNLEQQIEEENIQTTIKLDYKLKTCDERAQLVTRIIESTPKEHLSNRYLEILGDYIMGAISKEEKKDRTYLTDNRLVTVNKRETSLEGLIEKFENGADGIYNLITNDKNIILTPKVSITEQDIKDIPELQALREEIKVIEEECKKAVGKRKYLLKKQLIEMRQQQYILKGAFKPTICNLGRGANGGSKVDLSETRTLDKNGEIHSTGLISLLNPDHIAALLTHYNGLKIETHGRYNDFYFLLKDFDALISKALQDDPMLQDIVNMKLNDKAAVEIREMLKEKYNKDYTVQYISSLWRIKIPKLIADKEQEEWLYWYYTTNNKLMKRCSCCKQEKPAHSHFFSKNNTSKDGFYSICKKCRNKKQK